MVDVAKHDWLYVCMPASRETVRVRSMDLRCTLLHVLHTKGLTRCTPGSSHHNTRHALPSHSAL
jgi:hypothetical protein